MTASRAFLDFFRANQGEKIIKIEEQEEEASLEVHKSPVKLLGLISFSPGCYRHAKPWLVEEEISDDDFNYELLEATV